MPIHDLVIIGGGPAGIATAISASELGIDSLIIERTHELGGKYMAVQMDSIDTLPIEPEVDQMEQLFRLLEERGIQSITNAKVWRIDPSTKTIYVDTDNEGLQIQCKNLLLSTGALERPLPFPGWTLPGVMTGGAAQLLLAREN